MKKGYLTQFTMKSTMPHIVWTAYRLSCDKHIPCDAVVGFGGSKAA